MADQMSRAVAAFLEARGIDLELAIGKGLSSESGRGGGDLLVFPFVREGRVINHKRRTITGEKRFWQDPGADKAAWNEDCLRDDSLLGQPLIITEGELDALAAIQAGFLRTISVPDGAPPPKKDGDKGDKGDKDSAKYSWLPPIKPLLMHDRAPEIVIASDGDANGGQLLHDLALRLDRARCKYLVYPLAKAPEARGRERLKDLNEVLEDYGAEGVRQTIAKARWLKLDGLYEMSALPEPPETPIWDLGPDFRLLSENMRFRPGDLSVCTGIPNYGKSTFANALWCALIQRHGLKVVWASMEQMTKPDHRRALRNWYIQTDALATAAQLQQADAWIEKHHLFIQVSEDNDATLDHILELAAAAVVRHGVNALIIDPWNELEHTRDKGISLTEHVSASLRQVRRWARTFKVHVMILAHPTKSVQGEGGVYRRPRMYDISDSAAWNNKADLGFVVHRPNDEETQIVVEKSRYHEVIGAPGEVFAHFSRQSRRYTEIGRESMAEARL